MNFRPQKGLMYVAIGIADLFIWIFLGLLLMDYDDFYEGSKGVYGSRSSMTPFQKRISMGYDFGAFLHLVLAFYILGMLGRKKIAPFWNRSR